MSRTNFEVLIFITNLFIHTEFIYINIFMCMYHNKTKQHPIPE